MARENSRTPRSALSLGYNSLSSQEKVRSPPKENQIHLIVFLSPDGCVLFICAQGYFVSSSTMWGPRFPSVSGISIPLMFLCSPTKKPENKAVNNKLSSSKMEVHKPQRCSKTFLLFLLGKALLSPGRLWMVPIWSDDYHRWAGLEPPHLEVKLDQRSRSQEAHRLPNELGHEHQALETSRQSLEGRGQKSHTNGLSERIHFLSPCLLGISKKMNRD